MPLLGKAQQRRPGDSFFPSWFFVCFVVNIFRPRQRCITKYTKFHEGRPEKSDEGNNGRLRGNDATGELDCDPVLSSRYFAGRVNSTRRSHSLDAFPLSIAAAARVTAS